MLNKTLLSKLLIISLFFVFFQTSAFAEETAPANEQSEKTAAETKQTTPDKEPAKAEKKVENQEAKEEKAEEEPKQEQPINPADRPIKTDLTEPTKELQAPVKPVEQMKSDEIQTLPAEKQETQTEVVESTDDKSDTTEIEEPKQVEEPKKIDEPTTLDSGVKANQMRFTIMGAVSVPSTGQNTGGGIGGFIGYDFSKYNLGLELWLAQIWSSDNIRDEKMSMTLLEVRPGLRYRFWGEQYKAYVAGHAGLTQAKYTVPQAEHLGDFYKEKFSLDGGAGLEIRLAKIVLIDIFAAYEYHHKPVPREDGRKTTAMHGLLLCIGVGVASEL